MVPYIPAEGVRSILLSLHNSNENHAFTSCHCINSTWNGQGRAIRWQHILLDGSKSENFIAVLASAENTPRSTLGLIRSITLRSADEEAWTWKDDLVPSLTKWFARMPGLQSLSFMPSDSDYLLGCLSANTTLTGLIYSLNFCSNVENLEIGRIGFFVVTHEDGDHICVALCKILPRLRGLKLSKTPCCSRMLAGLKQSCPKLEEVVIQVQELDVREN